MQYKDLIYKITSENPKPVEKDMKTMSPDINAAKKSVQVKDVLIGVMIGEDTVLNKGISSALRCEVERTLTVLFNSPISDSFAFLPYDKKSLGAMLELFPDRNHYFIADKDIFSEVTTLKQQKINLKQIFASTNTNEDFANKIDYLVTVNIDELESSLSALLSKRNVMVFPLSYRGTTSISQREKLVVPDASGWSYNPSSGKWIKNWGWDGSQEIPSWKAPDDWNLEAEPKYNYGF